MPNGDDHDLFDGFINRVVHKIGILPGHDLAHALDGLPPSDLGPQNEILQRIEDGAAHTNGSCGISGADIVRDVDKILGRAGCEAKLHLSKRRKAASTSASVANSRRCACARPSSTADKCAGSISSGSPSSPAQVSIARAISSWLSGGSCRTASSAFSRSLVMPAGYRDFGFEGTENARFVARIERQRNPRQVSRRARSPGFRGACPRTARSADPGAQAGLQANPFEDLPEIVQRFVVEDDAHAR